MNYYLPNNTNNNKIILQLNKNENNIENVEVVNDSVDIQNDKLEELLFKARLLDEIYELTGDNPIEYINELNERVQILEEKLLDKTTELNYKTGKFKKIEENLPRLLALANKVHQYNKKNYEDSEDVLKTMSNLLN